MILLLGNPHHMGLQILNESLQARATKQVVFVAMEAFPSRVGLYLGATAEESSLVFADEGESLRLSDITALAMDGFYVTAESLTGLDLADIPYVQTETWSMLIALFEIIARHALVANNLKDREALATRWSTLRYLARRGIPVPRTLVTSDRAAVQAFATGPVGHKAVGDAAEVLTEFDPTDEARLEKLSLCPVHFEEAPQGRTATLTIVGDRVFVFCPEGDPPGEELQKQCQAAAANLGLVLAEVPLRYTDRWLATGLRTFPSPNTLLDPEVLDAATSLLERA